MKPLLLFAGEHYYPSGGVNDFRGDFNTIEEAIEAIANSSCDWWHVADENMRIVKSGGR